MNILKKILLISLVIFSSSSYSSKSNLFSAGIPSLAPMLENVTPAVVNIYTISETEQRGQYIDDPFLRKFFNIPGQQKSRKKNRAGLGSGVIINNKKGYIITNNHVIAKAKGSVNTDFRLQRRVALLVEEGTSPTPFLSPGPFEAIWRGMLRLDKRERLYFSFDGFGKVILLIDGEEVLQVEGEDLSTSASERLRLNGGNQMSPLRFWV